MHGQHLLEFGRLLGLTQSTIAEHFGINRSQVHRWAQGERAIPADRLEPLLQLVSDAVQRYLDSGQGDLWHSEPADPPRPGLTGREVTPPLRPQIERLLRDLIIENMEVRGVGPSASVRELGDALQPYFAMAQDELLKPTNALQLLRLSTQLSVFAEMLAHLASLYELTTPERSSHADSH